MFLKCIYKSFSTERLLFRESSEKARDIVSQVETTEIQTPEQLKQAIVGLDKEYDTVKQALEDENFDVRSRLTQLADQLSMFRMTYGADQEAMILIEEAESMIKDLEADLNDISADFSIDRYVGYHQVGIISPESGTTIETAGLKPCVGVLLVGNRKSDGKRMACMLHFAPQFLNRDNLEEQKEHLTITRDLLHEGLTVMQDIEPSSMQAVLSGHSDFHGKEWEEMSVAERNASNVVQILNEGGITNIKQHYSPESDYRSLHYNIDTDRYCIREDSENKEKAHSELQIYHEGSLEEVGMQTLPIQTLSEQIRTFINDQGYSSYTELITNLADDQLPQLQILSVGSQTAILSGRSLFSLVEFGNSLYLIDAKTAGTMEFNRRYQELTDPELQFISELEKLGFSLDEKVHHLEEVKQLFANGQRIPTDFIIQLTTNLDYQLRLSDIEALDRIDREIANKEEFISFAKKYVDFTREVCSPDLLDKVRKLYQVPGSIAILEQCPDRVFGRIGYRAYAPSMNTFAAFCWLKEEPEFSDLNLGTLELEDIRSRIDQMNISRKKEIALKLYEQNACFCISEILDGLNFNEQGSILTELLGDDFDHELDAFNTEEGLSLEIVGIDKEDQIILTNTFKRVNKTPVLIKLPLYVMPGL